MSSFSKYFNIFQSLEPLVSTLEALSGPNTSVIMSYELRTDGNKPELQRRFFALMEKYFTQSQIAIEDHHEMYRSEDILIHEFKKKDQ